MAESATKIYLFTDHSAVTVIANAKNITRTVSLERKNTRLVRAS